MALSRVPLPIVLLIHQLDEPLRAGEHLIER